MDYSDPSAVKVQMVASPVNPPQTYVVGTIAAPPVVVHSTPVTNQPPPMMGMRRPPPSPGRWADALCDWPTNLYPSCYCACCVCCGIYLVAQSKIS